jgi:hypothetical protein
VTREQITAAVAALTVIGMARSAWFHFVAEPRHDVMRTPIDPRYDELRPFLPRSGQLGYVSDEGVATGAPGRDLDLLGSRRFDQAQYALAPLVLRYDDQGAALVIADLRDPERLQEILREKGLVVVAHPTPGVALLRRQ